MFARRTVKTLVSLLLIASILSGIFPFEPFAAAIAYAQSFSVTNPGDYSWTLDEAENAGADAVRTQGEWQYVILPSCNYAVIVGHTDSGAADVHVPDVLGGADIVGIAAGVFAAHGALKAVTLPGNVYAIGKNALPKGVVIRGYNASYPLTYASKNGYPFENISEYDFRKGVVDYADIRVGNFERVSEKLVRLRTLEASRLSEGKRFFLIDPLNPYAISYYTAQTISEPDENGFVTIVCETPEIDDLFYSYNLENEAMVMDPNSVVLYNGTTLLDQPQSATPRWTTSAGPEYTFGLKSDIPLPGVQNKLTVAGTYSIKYTISASGGLFQDEKVVVKESSGLNMMLKYTHTFAEADDTVNGTSMSVDDLRKRMAYFQRKAGTLKDTSFSKSKLNLGTAVIFSWAGLVNITLTYGFDYEITGNISATFVTQSEATYTYIDDELEHDVSPKKKSLEISADATAKAGISANLSVYITFMPLFSAEFFFGVEATAKMSYSHGLDNDDSTSINMLDTITIESCILLEVTLKLVIVEVASFKFTLYALPALHMHHFNFEFTPYPDEFGQYDRLRIKNKLHWAEDCPYDVKTAQFVFPWLRKSDDDYIYTQVDNLVKGAELPEPAKPDLSKYDRRFLGWNTRASLSSDTSIKKWPHTIDDSLTFYAESDILRDVKFVYTNNKPVAPMQECIKGDVVTLPEGDGSHEIVAWARVDKNLTILEPLPEGTTTYTVPGEDVILCALCPDDIRINYHTGIGADVRTYYAPRNTTYTLLTAKELAITDRARFDFVAWTDLSGTVCDSTITLDKDSPSVIDIYADWAYNPEKLTATALTQNDFGTWSDADNNTDPIYSSGNYYSYSQNSDGTLTVTGFITSHKVQNENGTTSTITVSPTNLRIPSSIYVESEGVYRTVTAIGEKAFYNLPTLLEVTIPSTVTSIGASAFAYSGVKLIDLQAATGMTQIPASFAQGCHGLKCVLLHDQIASISSNAFASCSSLTSVNINAATIGSSAFKNCTSLSSVKLGRVTSIGASAFAGCSALESLFIPDTAAAIGDSFISGCTNLKKLTFDGAPQTITSAMMSVGSGSLLEEVVLGDGVTTLSSKAFGNDNYGFPYLKKISLPSTLNELGQYALKNTAVEELELYSHKMNIASYSFSNCASLKKVTIHGGVVNTRAFSGCYALEEVILGDGVTAIGASAFSGCSSLKSVTMGSALQTVGDSAFANCTSLSSLSFPDSVTSYGSDIISGCSGLETLHIGGGCATLTSSMFKIGETNKLHTLTMAEGVTTLNANAFDNGGYGFASLQTVTLPAGITTIGEYAFRKAGMHTLILSGAVDLRSSAFANCPNLDTLVVEGSIYDAFMNCTALKNLTIRGEGTIVGTNAFKNCYNLENVTIEEGVASIADHAFYGCSSIKKLVFPDSVTRYGHLALEGCTGLEELTIGGGQKTFKITGVYNYGDDYGYSAFYIGPNSSLKRIVIREGVQELGKYALANRRYDTYASGVKKNYGYPALESIVLPKSLKTIGTYALTCSGMTSVTLNSSPSIGYGAFENCKNLKSITIDNALGAYAFSGCTALETVTVKGGCTSISESAFNGCTSLTSVKFEEGVTSIGYHAFTGCTSLKSISFPDSVTSYAQQMLEGCTALENLTIGGGQKTFKMTGHYNYGSEYGYSPFYIGPDSSLKHIVIREGVEVLSPYALANRRYDTYASGTKKNFGYPQLESVTLPNSLLSIGAYAFVTPALQSITIPDNVTYIGTYAFENNTGLKTLVLRGNDLVVDEGAFKGCTGLVNVTIAEGVKSFAHHAFANCTSLKRLSFPDSVTSYAHQMIEGCTGLEDLTIGGGQKSFKITGNWQYGDDYGYSAFYIGPNSSLKRLVLREGVEEVGKYAFANRNYSPYASYPQVMYGYPMLESLVLPESLHTIGTYAFTKSGMSSITFSSSPVIGYNAFQDCANLKSITVNSAVSNYAFAGCASLESVTIQSGCTSIGEYAFSGCTNLKKVTFEEGVKSIGYGAFKGCKSIKTLAFPDSVTSYANGIISGCSGLEELTIGGGQASHKMPTHYQTGNYNGIGSFYIGANSSLKRLVIREGVQSLGSSLFTNGKYDPYSSDNSATVYGYPQLESIILPQSLTSISSSVFKTPALQSIIIPENVTSIGGSAFANCTALETLELRGNGLSVGDYAFSGCASLKTVIIKDGVKSFGSNVFKNCTSIKSLSFPDSVTSYGRDMLAGCTGLEELTIGGGCPSFNVGTHYQNGRLNGTTPFYIGRNSSLKRLVIREGVQSLSNAALSNGVYSYLNADNSATVFGYPMLESVILPESLTSIGYSNFSYWPSLSYARLSSGLTNFGDGAVPSGATLCTNAYNDLVNTRALSNGIPYLVRDVSTYPTFTLLRVTNASAPESMLLSGISTVTTGLQGKEVALPDGYGVLSSEEIAYADALPALEAPEIEGYVFGGWYTDADFTLPWTDAPMPACTLTLYARMLPISRVAFAIGDESAGTQDETLPEGFSLHSETTAIYLDPVTPPTPEVPGRIFVGWYKDADFTQSWSVLFDRMPETALTLYGKFVPQYAARFALNLPDGASLQSDDLPEGFTLYDSFLVNEGEAFTGPQEPIVTGYVFSGWYEEPAFIHPWSGQTMPEGGVTIYGKLERITAGAQYVATATGLQLKKYVLEQDQSGEVYLPAKVNGQKVTDIGAYAFNGEEITFLHLPEYLESFHADAFDGMNSLCTFDISPNSAHFAVKNGVLYSKDMTILYRYPQGKTVRTFTVPETVVRIAPYAFENCTYLRTVNLPAALTDIGEFAFSGCVNLTGIAIPDGVTALREGTFDRCSNLVSLSAYGLTEIAGGENVTPAFALHAGLEVYGPLAAGALRDYCSAVVNGERTLLVPYNMRTLSLYVDGTLAETLRLEAGMPLTDELFGVTLPDGTLVLDWYHDSSFTQLWDAQNDVMPDSDLSIYATRTRLFDTESITLTLNETEHTGLMLTAYNGHAKDLVIPEAIDGETVIALGDAFLAGVSNSLYTLEIGGHILSIADTALESSAYPFTGVIITDADTYAAQWADAHGYAWEALTYTVSFEADGCVVSPISGAKGTEINLPTPEKVGVTFAGWYTDPALTLPAALNDQGLFVMPGENICLYAAWDGTFEDVPFTYTMEDGSVTITGYTGSAAALTIPETINGLYVTAIGKGAFEGRDTLLEIVLPDSIRTIGERAFANSALITADLGSASSIGENAFEGCAQLANLILDNVGHIAENAFAACTSLRTLKLPETLYRISPFAFSGCTGLSEITLPDSLYTVSESAFDACSSLETVHIGSGTSLIAPNAFSGCTNLTSFTVSSENAFYTAQDGVLLSADQSTLVCYPAAKDGASYTLPEGLTAISAYAFSNASALEQVTLPASLTQIGESAFRNCTALTRFALPEGTQVSSIAQNAFLGCGALTEVVLSSGVTAIEDGAFMNCPVLATIVIPASVTSISTLAFSAAPNLKIIGTTGSAAHTYALDNYYLFSDPDAVEVEALTLSADCTVLTRGETLALTLTFEPAAAAETTAIRWMTTNSDVAIVTDGTVRAIGGGTATLFAIAGNGVQAQLAIEVQVPVTDVLLNEIPSLARGEIHQAAASVLPLTATDKTLTWESSDETVLTVDQSGLITAVTAGEATLTVTAQSGVAAQAAITVFNAVESIAIATPDEPLYAVAGLNTATLSATITPDDATDKTLIWSVSDETIATIEPDTGVLTALMPGEIVVTATAADARGVSSEAALTVLARDLSAMDAPVIEDIAYTGAPIVLDPVLVMDEVTLVRGTDYTLSDPQATTVGSYVLTVTGTGKYTGAIDLPFNIIKATPEITYTGPDVGCIDTFTVEYTVTPACETTVTYALVGSDESLTPIDGQPTEAGLYELTITALGDDNCNDASQTVRVRLYAIDSIQLSCTQLPLFLGQSVCIPWVNTPAGEAPEIIWSVDNADVVSVDDAGRLSAVSVGTEVVTATLAMDETKSASCAVTVYESSAALNLPAALTHIEDEAFQNTAFARVIMGEKVESIGSRVFSGSTNLKQIQLPASVTDLALDAFAGCSAVLVCESGSHAATFADENTLPYVIR